MKPVDWVVRLTVPAVVAVLVTGCDRAGTDDRAAERSLPPGQASTFDLFLGDKVDFLDFAIRQLNAECMAKVGYPQMKQAGNDVYKGAGQMLLISRERFRGFASEQEARAQGFGQDQAAERPPLVSYDPSFDKQMAACDKQSHEAIGVDGRAILDSYNEVGNAIATEFNGWSRDSIRASLSPLVDCLEKEGFQLRDRDSFINKLWDVKLFDIPLGTLDGEPYTWQPAKRPGTVQVGPAVPARRYVPSGREGELAAAWYRCDQASGRVEKLLSGARAEEAKIASKYEDRLAELNPKLEELAKRATVLVGRT
ncbi:hypothetical protein KBX50_17405 [Micromonospora sp. C51]|uniref:hypothetical protein n=1 Tax=Micromonospora sp. C51 TaxID=2824879 RepID=UPI001B384758|nr:hypothetical protein [Micromonospora sp. C51]MBQ1050240.1 hypothetical protein [Micromonospora sp. C51]